MTEPPPESGDVTRLLARLRGGDNTAVDQLLPLVYDELRSLARAVFSNARQGNTLQPTALLHEAWIKLAGHLPSLEDRRHFFIVAGKAMRQVVLDHAKGRGREKRGGDRKRVTLATAFAETPGTTDAVELDDSLRKLAEQNARHAEVAELRIFSGLSIDEVAETLGVSARTVDSDWAMAKAWLRRELNDAG